NAAQAETAGQHGHAVGQAVERLLIAGDAFVETRHCCSPRCCSCRCRDAPSFAHHQASAWLAMRSRIRMPRVRTGMLKYRRRPPKTRSVKNRVQASRGTPMIFTRSLRGQVLTLLGASLLLMLLIALASFQLLNDSARSYQRLLEGPASISLRVAS